MALFRSNSVNISNAAILGLKSELGLTTGTKYNAALTIFFVPYILLEIPSNILLKKLKPHVWCTLSKLSAFGAYIGRIIDLLGISIALYVWIWSRDDLPRSDLELGWIDDHSILFGSIRDGHVPRL